MDKVRQLTGAPWHIEVLRKNEDDDRRHKYKCVHHDRKRNYCRKCNMRCIGSAHCKYYELRHDSSFSTKKKEYEQAKRQQKKESLASKNTLRSAFRAEPFNGVKMIDMRYVVPAPHFKKPSKRKVTTVIEHYKMHHKIDKPIVVSCNGDKYVVEDKYLRYYAAVKLNLAEIPARIGTCEDGVICKTYSVGQRVQHNKHGKGTVMEMTPKFIWIQFDTGKKIRFDTQTIIDENKVTKICASVNKK